MYFPCQSFWQRSPISRERKALLFPQDGCLDIYVPPVAAAGLKVPKALLLSGLACRSILGKGERSRLFLHRERRRRLGLRRELRLHPGAGPGTEGPGGLCGAREWFYLSFSHGGGLTDVVQCAGRKGLRLLLCFFRARPCSGIMGSRCRLELLRWKERTPGC